MPVPESLTRIVEEDPSVLVDTRWVLHLFEDEDERIFSTRHVIQIIDVRDNVALCATLYSEPFRHFRVPVSDFLARFAAFVFLGTAADLEWVRCNAHVTFDSTRESAEIVTWQIEQIRRVNVDLWRRDEQGTHRTTTRIERVVREGRPPTRVEEETFAFWMQETASEDDPQTPEPPTLPPPPPPVVSAEDLEDLEDPISVWRRLREESPKEPERCSMLSLPRCLTGGVGSPLGGSSS